MNIWETFEGQYMSMSLRHDYKFKPKYGIVFSHGEPIYRFDAKEAIDFTPELRNGANVRNLETGKTLTFLSRKGNVYSFLGGIVILKDTLTTNYELMDR